MRKVVEKVRDGEFSPTNSDGCTLISWVYKHMLRHEDPVPFVQCCIEHDRAYWYGGTWRQRKAADEALRDCVLAMGYKFWAWFMYYGVRAFGSPRLPFKWRWAHRVTILEGIVRGYSAGQ
jgi:hypothetical protein